MVRKPIQIARMGFAATSCPPSPTLEHEFYANPATIAAHQRGVSNHGVDNQGSRTVEPVYLDAHQVVRQQGVPAGYRMPVGTVLILLIDDRLLLQHTAAGG